MTSSLFSIGATAVGLALVLEPPVWLVLLVTALLPPLSSIPLWNLLRHWESPDRRPIEGAISIAKAMRLGFVGGGFIAFFSYFVNISLLFRGSSPLYLSSLLIYALILAVLATALVSLFGFRLSYQQVPMSQLEEQGLPWGFYAILISSYGRPNYRKRSSKRFFLETFTLLLALVLAVYGSGFNPLALVAIPIFLGLGCFIPLMVYSTQRALDGIDSSVVMKLVQPFAKIRPPQNQQGD